MKLKRIITIILTLFFAITPVQANETTEINAFEPLTLNSSEVIFKQVTFKVNAIDPILINNSLGGRGINQLIIYTPNYGIHTGTNEYGTEAIVQENTVTALSGADSSIPKDGLVISGHGIAKNWIRQNITVGSKVYVDIFNKTITVYTTSDSYTYEARKKIEEANSMIDYYKNTMEKYNYSLPASHIQIAENYLKIAENEKKNSVILKQYTQEAIDEANMAIKTSVPYIKDELRGVWLRPTETTEEQIITTLDNLKANGFNNIFLETYFHGKTIFPSKTMNKYGFTVQYEKFQNIDPLAIWIKEAHKRDMKIHVWFQSFYVGNIPSDHNPSSILAVRPDWGNKTKRYANRQNATKSTSEHNGYFLDPANPQVQEFLVELITEIITEYKPDGINLDYIRYPLTTTKTDMDSWGYTDYARNDFKKQFGKDPIDLTTSDVLWYDWNQYRRNSVTEFVKKVGKIGKENNVYISTVIFPDLASALSSKQQDWRSWSTNNYVDGFTPLFLTYDSQMLTSMMNDVMNSKSEQTDLLAGLFVTFMGGAPEDLIRQIYETRKMKVNGIILFDYAHTTPVYTTTLMASAFNEDRPKKTVIAEKKKWKIFPWQKKKTQNLKKS